MSDFDKPRWAVLSERGVELTGVTYTEAAGAVKRFRAERVRGLCIVTLDAARRFTGEEQEATPDEPTREDAT